jgi:hypothetical protein
MALTPTLLWYGAILSLAMPFAFRRRRPQAVILSLAGRDALSKSASFGALPMSPPLPEDIPAGAWSLWRGGHSVASLSLLYRGALARLTAIRRIKLDDAWTEEESILLIHRHHRLEVSTYFKEIVYTWQRAAYAGLLPTNTDMKRLCEDWARYLSAGR